MDFFNKDKILDKYDKVLNNLGDKYLTKDNNLIGNRVLGKSSHIRTYNYDFKQSDLYIKIVGDNFAGNIELDVKD